MTTRTPPPTSPRSPRDSRRPGVRAFAIAAVGMLAVAGLAVLLSGRLTASPASIAGAQDPAAYAADATTRLGELADLGNAAPTAVLQADAMGAALRQQAEDALASAVADAGVDLQAAVGSSGLPALPGGYLPGMDLADILEATPVAPFEAPQFTAMVDGSGFVVARLGVDASPVDPRSGPHLPATGLEQVDGLANQVTAAYGQLGALVPLLDGTLPTDPLSGLPVGGLPITGIPALPGVPGLPPLPLELPTGGSYPQQAQDANDAVDPDEQGATSAQIHADAVLGVGGNVLTGTEAGLTGLLAAYEGLADRVDDLTAAANDAVAQAETDVPAAVEERVDLVVAQANHMKAEATRLVEAYKASVTEAAAKASSSVDATVETQVRQVRANVARGVAVLDDHVVATEALVEARRAEIESQVDGAVGHLEGLQVQLDADLGADIEAVKAAGEAALERLDAQGNANVKSLQAAAARLQADGDDVVADLQREATAMKASVELTATHALDEAGKVKAYLLEAATVQADLDTAAIEDAAKATLKMVREQADAYTAKLLEDALGLTDEVDGLLEDTQALVDDATVALGEHVDADLDYILKVASDYSKVPTSEREARAAFWAAVATADTGALEDLVATGDRLVPLAEQVAQAAEDARAALLEA